MKKFFYALDIILTVGLAVGLGFLVVKSSIPNYALLLLTSLPVATIFHELGHLFSARA
ncbi:MAG: hypothetical protein K2N22_05495 [Clostridia bacterium]|nr:hypothetical protein [Clostridia bacterium]